MRKKTSDLYAVLFAAGLAAGLSLGLRQAMASSPEGETSAGENPASVQYDESWAAVDSLVSGDGGYVSFNPANRSDTGTAGKMENLSGTWTTTLYPKMVVTKWRVHGHIHFE